MSAITILYSGKENPPAWINYEEDEANLREGNYFIPLFWLAMFNESDIEKYEDEEDDEEDAITVPYFCAMKEKCLKNFEERKVFLKFFLPKSEALFDAWVDYIQNQTQEILSVDFSEVYFMDGEVNKDINNIMKGFGNPSSDMIESIVALCGFQYDPENRDLILENDKTFDYYMIGYKMGEE